jgi:hypothetical protein
VHTHSSRTTTFGGGIGDGLNDRCDMILVSGNLLDQHFYSYVLNSQTNFGNDGEHFDLAVNTDFNNSVPDSVADALYYASNHLPVYLDFTVNAGATPVELKNFQASVLGNDVLLSWTTVSEANNYGFAIERKAVNGRWEEIGFQTGKGTTNALNFYSFIDKAVKAGHYLYQLKQIDFDGQIKFSPAIEVVVGTAKNYLLAQNYPNPFNASTKIQFQVPEKTQVKLTLYDMLGKKIAVLTDNVFDAGTHEILVDASELNSGLYFYKLETINFNIMKKLMILK